MDIKKELIEGIIQELVKYLIEDKAIDLEEAMDIIYNSIVFDKVLDSETALYIESPSYIYELLKDELVYGELVQKDE